MFVFCQENLGFSSKTTFFCRGQLLPQKLLDFLSGFDIVVHSAYGQTESSSVLTANVPGRWVLLVQFIFMELKVAQAGLVKSQIIQLNVCVL